MENPSGNKKILLVEDDVFIQDIYQSKLRQEGYEVVCADNGVEALTKLEGFAPDLIMSDILMPYMDGLEFLGKIRADERWKKTPVIMMTNLSEREKIDEAQKKDIADYVVKSHFTPVEVMDKVRTLLAA